MGVPVVSMSGDRYASRMSLSILEGIGRSEWVVESRDEYIDLATRLAQDKDGLAEFRAKLRPEIEESALCRHKEFALDFESALESIWSQSRPIGNDQKEELI